MSIKRLLSKRPNILLVLLLFLLSGTNVMAQSGYVSLISNGDFEGNDFSSFVYKVNQSDPTSVTANDLVVDGGSKCLKITSMQNAANTWDTQFFISLDQPLHTGDEVRFSMRVKASQQVSISSQAHRTPGDYIHWAMVGSPNLTTAWVEYSQNLTVSSDQNGAQCIAFNLNENKVDAIDYYFDDISVEVEQAYIPDDSEWESVVTNGDFEGNDFSSIIYKVNGSETYTDMTAQDIAYDETDNNHYFTITTTAGAAYSWDTQFFVQLDKALKKGDKIKFSMRAKASQSAHISTEAHRTLGDYLGWGILGSFNITTDWKEFSYEPTIAEGFNGCQTLTFTLNENLTDAIEFCFDDIELKVFNNPNITFDDDDVEDVCVANWDTDGNGKLSYTEAAAVTNLGTAFKNNRNIASFRELQYFTGLTAIGDGAFQGCIQLSTLIVPENVTSIGEAAFSGCTLLYDVSIYGSVTSIGDYAFEGCTYLTSTPTSGSVTSIGDYAYSGCRSLRDIYIPGSVTSIGDYAFYGCGNVTEVRCEATTIPVTSSSTFENFPIGSVKLYVPEASYNLYKAAEPWKNFKKILALDATPNFMVNSINVPDVIAVGEDVQVTVNVTNESLTDQVGIRLWMQKEGTQVWTFVQDTYREVDPGETGDVLLYFIPQSTGTYLLKVTNDDSEVSLKEKTVTVKELLQWTDSESDLRYSYFEGSGTATVIEEESGAYQDMTSVVIPASVTIDNAVYSVTAIGDWAFQNCWQLTSVTLTDGITSIGDYAFNNCGNLKNIVIPEGIVSIGDYAFLGCQSLQRLELPSTLTSIGDYVVQGDVALSAVVSRLNEPLPISDQTFVTRTWDDAALQNIITPCPAVLYVPVGTKSAYQAITGWTQFKAIEEGEPLEAKVGDLKYTYFTGSKKATVIAGDYQGLESVEIPAIVTIGNVPYTVTEIGSAAFQSCYQLTSVTIPNGIESIGNSAFAGVQFSEITLPTSLRTIGSNAFQSCDELKKIVIPEGVETIGDRAFSYCYSLQKLELPSTLTSIGDNVVLNNYNLSAVVSHIQAPFQVSNTTFIYNHYWDDSGEQTTPCPATLYVPVGKKSAYQAITGWTKFKGIEEGEPMEATVNGLKYSYVEGSGKATVAALVYDENVQQQPLDLEIPASVTIEGQNYAVTAIGASAFRYCQWITSVTIPEGIEFIGDEAFGSGRFSEITLPTSLRSIGKSTFWDCSNLRSIVIPEGVLSIGEFAFQSCESLQRLELPSTLTSIGERVVANCPALLAVVSRLEEPIQIDELTFVSSYWDNAAQQNIITPCPATLYVPVGKKSAYQAITGWTKFKAIVEGEPLEATVNGLKYSYVEGSGKATVIALVYNENETQQPLDLEIPASVTIDRKNYTVTAIGASAFRDCDGITSVTIPDGVESIGNYAFANNGFSEIALPSNLKTIGEYAFQGCGSLKNVVIPEGVESIGESAFSDCWSLLSMELPSTLTSIGDYIVNYASAMTKVVSRATEPAQIGDRTFVSRNWDNETQQYIYNLCSATLYVPAGKKSAYQAITGWTKFKAIEEGEPLEATVNGLKYSYVEGSGKATVAALVYDENEQQEPLDLEIPASVTIDMKNYAIIAIGTSAFRDCHWITSVTIPDGVESIGNYAFANNGFSEIALPSNLKTIGEYAFQGCGSLKNLVIPEGAMFIGVGAFSNCRSLLKLELPSTIISMGDNVVNNSSVLSAVVSHLQTPCQVTAATFAYEVDWNNGEQQITPCPAILYVPSGTKSAYQAISGWTQFKAIEEGELLEATVNGLKYSYVEGSGKATVIAGDYQQLTSIVIPASVTIEGQDYAVKAIGASAFRYSYQLTSVKISEGIESIGSSAFVGDPLIEITLPSSLRTIGDDAFGNCSSLKEILVPEGVESIGRNAFAWCYSLQTLELPSTLTSIGESIILDDSRLKTVVSYLQTPFQIDDMTFVLRRYWGDEGQVITPCPATLYVPEESIAAYQAIVGWTKFKSIAAIDPNDKYYESCIKNGDFEDTDYRSFAYNHWDVVEEEEAVTDQDFLEEYDDYYNRYLHITSSDNAAYTWTTQFFVKLDRQLKVGDKIKFSMRAKASKPVTITTQAHTAPLKYLTYQMMGNFNLTTEWQDFTYEGTIVASQDGFACIAFQLNEDLSTTEFYFDDITVRAYREGGFAKKGDVNGNGKVEIDDTVCILRHLVNKPNDKFVEAAADVNGSGKIDIDDAVMVLKFLVGKIPALSRSKVQDTDTDEYDPD